MTKQSREDQDTVPRTLERIDHITLHPGEAGASTISVWFTESRNQGEKVTFSPFDLFDYRLFAARVLEMTGHLFRDKEVERAADPWHAEMLWREVIAEKLEHATVDPQPRHHWKPLID